MIHSTATVAVNPHGEPALTREQVWQGLVLKARDARLFLPPGLCTHCDVIEDHATHIVREATIAGADLREIITFDAPRKITFFQATGPREGAIVNELFEDSAGAAAAAFLLLPRSARQAAGWGRRTSRAGVHGRRDGIRQCATRDAQSHA